MAGTILLTMRTLRQFPRIPVVLVFSLIPPIVMFLLFGSLFETITRTPGFPTKNYHEYLVPAIVMVTAVFGMATSALLLVNDFENRYFYKLLTTPTSLASIVLGRLLADGVRVYANASLIVVLGLLFDARVETGLAGALLMVLIGVLFAMVTVGAFTMIVALKTKDASSVQAVFPLFFILMFMTQAFQSLKNIDNDVLETLIALNPAEYVLRAMRDLMLEGYDLGSLSLALAVIGGFALVTVPITIVAFRSVYR